MFIVNTLQTFPVDVLILRRGGMGEVDDGAALTALGRLYEAVEGQF